MAVMCVDGFSVTGVRMQSGVCGKDVGGRAAASEALPLLALPSTQQSAHDSGASCVIHYSTPTSRPPPCNMREAKAMLSHLTCRCTLCWQGGKTIKAIIEASGALSLNVSRAIGMLV